MKEGWEIKKLGEVCKIQTGKLDANAKVDDGEYPFFTCDSKPYRIDKFAFDDEAILISGNGSLVGHVNYYNGKFNAYQRTYVLTQFSSYYIPFLISYLKGYLRPYIMENKKGGCIPYITLPILQNFSIPTPPLSEQEQIVAELDLISGVIDKKKQQLKELDSLAQSIFYEMFGDPVENEKGWEVEKLGNKANISSSKRIFANEYTDTGIPFYRGKEITEKSKGNPTSVELYISKERYKEIKLNYGIPSVGDILVTAVGTIGNIWVVDSEEPFYFKDGNVLWLKIKDNTNSIYFKYILTILIDKYKEMVANGCAYPALTIVNLKEMPTCITPLSLQQQFAKKIEVIEKQKELIKQSIKETETLFNSRMEYYFNS